MKQVTSNMLLKGNLTPTEKFILLVQDDLNKLKTGKNVLTDADRDALENWKAQTNKEAHEWNSLNEGYKLTGRMNIEAELIFKDIQVAHLANLPVTMQLLFYPAYREMFGSIKTLENIKKVTIQEALEVANKQKQVKLKEGLDFDYAVYQLAFELLSKEDKERMNELYQEVEYDHQYLDQEEVIANLFNGKEELTEKAKEKLASMVAERSYNKFAKEYQFFHYFACIPIAEVGRFFLKSKGVEVKGKNLSKNQEADNEDTDTHERIDEVMKKYSDEHKISIEDMLKEGCLKWLDEGLFDEYTPLIVSSDSDLFERWLKTKVEAKTILLTHIKKNELVLRQRTERETWKDKLYSKELYDVELAVTRKVLENLDLELAVEKGEMDEKVAFEEFSDSIITGESLYAFKKEYDFVKNFKEKIDTYDPNLGIVYADDDPQHKEDHLDQEFIVCSQTEDGKPSIFSLFGMSLARLSGFFDGKVFFKEKTEKGKTYLEFKDGAIETIYFDRRRMIIEGYAKLLAFEKLFKRIGRKYDTALEHFVTERVKRVLEFIEQDNEAVRIATNTSVKEKEFKRSFFRRKEILYFKEDPLIYPEKIEPDEKEVKDHIEKFQKLFEEF